jgi:hypothetical protein
MLTAIFLVIFRHSLDYRWRARKEKIRTHFCKFWLIAKFCQLLYTPHIPLSKTGDLYNPVLFTLIDNKKLAMCLTCLTSYNFNMQSDERML